MCSVTFCAESPLPVCVIAGGGCTPHPALRPSVLPVHSLYDLFMNVKGNTQTSPSLVTAVTVNILTLKSRLESRHCDCKDSLGGQASPSPYSISIPRSSCLKSIVMTLLMPKDDTILSGPEPDTRHTALFSQLCYRAAHVEVVGAGVGRNLRYRHCNFR